MRGPTPPRGRERGVALIVVLWAVGLLAILISGLAAGASREARLASAAKAQAVARAAADGAISAAIVEVLRSGAASPGTSRFGGTPVAVRLDDLSGRMNPNLAPPPMMAALLGGLGVRQAQAESLAAAIADWRSPGLAASPHGAKAAEYLAAGLSYGPPGRPFETLDELGSVLGMTPSILAALKPHLTLWTTSGPVPAFADALVLNALRSMGVAAVGGAGNDAHVIAITAIARRRDAPLVPRRAVVRFGFSPDGRAWRILSWDDGDRTAD